MGLERGLVLIREGAYFEAHEELEDEWREAPADERDFLQGLVHVAVAWLHAERANRNGCLRQLEKAERRLDRYRPTHRGVDVELVLAGSSETALEGAALLAVYSLGLAVPFVLAAALFTRAMSAFRWLRDHYRVVQIAGGAIMVALGLLLFFERFYVLRVYLNRFLEWLGLEPAF